MPRFTPNLATLPAHRGDRAVRKNQRGAVAFIVAMTLAMLATIGIYALNAASNEVAAVGDERQAAQTEYVAEQGVLAGIESLNVQTLRAQKAKLRDPAQSDHQDGHLCVTLEGVPVGSPQSGCARILEADLQVLDRNNVPGPPENAPVARLGSEASPTVPEGRYIVELTEPSTSRLSIGNSDPNICSLRLTVAAIGQVAKSGVGDADRRASLSETVSRSRVTFDSVPCEL